VVLDAATHAQLVDSSGVEVVIDIEARTIAFGDRNAPFPLEPFARYCLLQGLDELGFLLEREEEIARFEESGGPAPWRL
jgi:3-isopropylmalate/(R)-2-methylmalate dehydratase small subunit